MKNDPPAHREEAPVYFFFRQSFLAYLAGSLPLIIMAMLNDTSSVELLLFTLFLALVHIALIFVCSLVGVILSLYPPLDRAWRRNVWVSPTIGALGFVGFCTGLWLSQIVNGYGFPKWVEDHLFGFTATSWILTVFGVLHTSFPWLLLPREKSDRVG